FFRRFWLGGSVPALLVEPANGSADVLRVHGGRVALHAREQVRRIDAALDNPAIFVQALGASDLALAGRIVGPPLVESGVDVVRLELRAAVRLGGAVWLRLGGAVFDTGMVYNAAGLLCGLSSGLFSGLFSIIMLLPSMATKGCRALATKVAFWGQ